MLKRPLKTAILLFLPVAAASAMDCVKVRESKAQTCMKFSMEQTNAAEKYGLSLTSPFKAVKRRLTNQGWTIDRNWLVELDPLISEKKELVCGNGWDAVCSTAFKRGHTTLVLTFSATNNGLPLVEVNEER